MSPWEVDVIITEHTPMYVGVVCLAAVGAYLTAAGRFREAWMILTYAQWFETMRMESLR